MFEIVPKPDNKHDIIVKFNWLKLVEKVSCCIGQLLHRLFHCSSDGIAVRLTHVTDMLLLHIAVQE
jgi:hypothetical protein